MRGNPSLIGETGNAESLDVFLRRMRRTNDNRWCDLEIYLNDKTEYVHTILAVSKSNKLNGILTFRQPPFSINMKEFSSPIVSSIIDWMYFGHLSVDLNKIDEYFKVIIHLGIDALETHFDKLLVEMASNGRHIEAMNAVANEKFGISRYIEESVMAALYGNYEKLTRNDIKHLSQSAVSSLLAANVRQSAKIAFINIAINWFRVPENLTHLNEVFDCLTVDGLASTDLAGFRKTLIGAILHDKDHMILGVSRRNGHISINMDNKPRYFSSAILRRESAVRNLFPAKTMSESRRDACRAVPELVTHWTRDDSSMEKEPRNEVEFTRSEMEDIRELPNVFNSSCSEVRQQPRGFTRSEMMELNQIPNVFGEKKVAKPKNVKKFKGSRSSNSSKSSKSSKKSLKPAGLVKSFCKKSAENEEENNEKKTTGSSYAVDFGGPSRSDYAF